ncbi:hypothetical protein [Vreelandella neptunia]|uniref:Uncharacterized protein n=1 Tax=Vreelandella neptunia TaxID=115551 RepID=A0ABZ0YR26_9GAMM|nr:hypothetical protein [Halomonas neptunia]MDN3561722.1 hypothetical protein [Halomonas neptunia]WQH14623.1 hypothetical protein SR894_08810 [Halomonas neptunia]
MEELLIEMRKVRKLLEVLVNQQRVEPATPGIIDQTASDARHFGLAVSDSEERDHAGEAIIPLNSSSLLVKPRDTFI